MWEVLQILRLLGRGESKSSIKRTTGADRKTIRGYLGIAEDLGWSADSSREYLFEADMTPSTQTVESPSNPGSSVQFCEAPKTTKISEMVGKYWPVR